MKEGKGGTREIERKGEKGEGVSRFLKCAASKREEERRERENSLLALFESVVVASSCCSEGVYVSTLHHPFLPVFFFRFQHPILDEQPTKSGLAIGF